MKETIKVDEREYIGRLSELWPRPGSDHSSVDVLALSEEAVRDYPGNASLLCMRGDLIQLAPASYQSEDDPKGCYLRAIEIDPLCCEAWESLGYYYDDYDDDYTRAIEAFKRAIECGAGPASVRGLARALAESGKRGDALATIDRALAQDITSAEKIAFSELREEIVSGDYDFGEFRVPPT